MKESHRNQIAGVLPGLGRGFQIAGSRIERELIVQGVGAQYRADRRVRYTGPHWIGYECGFRITLPGVGRLYVASEACLLEESGGPKAEITTEASLDRDQDAIRRSLASGSLSRSEPHSRLLDPLWNSRDLVHAAPEPVRVIVVDVAAGVVRTDPPGVEVQLHPPGPDELPCSEDELTELIKDVLFRGLGIRELAVNAGRTG